MAMTGNFPDKFLCFGKPEASTMNEVAGQGKQFDGIKWGSQQSGFMPIYSYKSCWWSHRISA